MGELSRFLPPFAADYSGAASVFYDLGGLVVMLDPGCCTYNYVDYDESRWDDGMSGIISAQLRTIDTILGADQGIITQVSDLIDELHLAIATLIGSPVPALIGMDIKGLAEEISSLCDIPVIGIETNGFDLYGSGIQKSYDALLDSMMKSDSFESESITRSASGHIKSNVLGLTPYDFGSTSNKMSVTNAINDLGIDIVCSLSMDYSIEELTHIAESDVNIVVSSTALKLARRLRDSYGTPYVVVCPFGRIDNELANACMSPIDSSPYRLLKKSSHLVDTQQGKPKMLIVAEQIIGHSLERYLDCAGFEGSIDVASFFWDREAAEALGTLTLSTEHELCKLISENKYDCIIADPLILRLPEAKQIPLQLPFVHTAVSSHLYANLEFDFVSSDAIAFSEDVLSDLS